MYYNRKGPVEAIQVVMDPEWGNFGKAEEWLGKFDYVKDIYVLTEGGVPEGLYFTYTYDMGSEIGSHIAKRDQWIVSGFRESFTILDDLDFRGRYVEGVDH